ncbi:alpha/beta fold hydrolase [Salinibacterium hongtaonis]|uniref:alpha/beta fold hydrolase n=1 Tax=Homoserinimonas hongtaonis TaxID=2079791 RepID=UPI000D396A64|nr:alpha/beta hydrolase [Salinibacterium hongtaonis]AWB90210.1 2-hydroxy-6-oxo-6-phenylhexa-2,4-dienoate hydrolase [Salinibacterium hongtaonis]
MTGETNAAGAAMQADGIRAREVTLPSGAVAHFYEAGDPVNPAVVLLHGGLHGASGLAGWWKIMPRLVEEGLYVVAPDRPGFGRADTREEHHPVRGHLSWIEFTRDFVDAIGLDRFAIGGNSQGAQLAAYLAVELPERIIRLALIASSGLNLALGIDRSLITEGVPFPRWDGTVDGMRDMLRTIAHRPEGVTDGVVRMRAAAAEKQAESYAAASKFNRQAFGIPEVREQLMLKGRIEALSIPAIYLYGMDDVLGPVENAYLQEDAMPNVQFFYPEDCGHQGQTDRPELFGQVLAEFFSTGQVRGATAHEAGVSTRRPQLADIVAG